MILYKPRLCNRVLILRIKNGVWRMEENIILVNKNPSCFMFPFSFLIKMLWF